MHLFFFFLNCAHAHYICIITLFNSHHFISLPNHPFKRSYGNDVQTRYFISKSSRLVTVAMDGGLLSSPVRPIGMSAHPGSLKTTISITAYNEKGFISRQMMKCQSGINARTQKHTQAWSSAPREPFLRRWHFQ